MRMDHLWGLGLAVLLIGGSVRAEGGAVTVLGGGYAEACSVAAVSDRSDHDSIQICTRALDTEVMSPRDRGATFINRGVLKMRGRAFDEARLDFDSGVHLFPQAGEGWANRGAAFVGLRRYQEGLTDIDKALALGGKEPEKAYFNRALAYEGLNDEKSAYFDYRKALELKPGWILPQHELLRFSVTRP